jgi:hypothetical protein
MICLGKGILGKPRRNKIRNENSKILKTEMEIK